MMKYIALLRGINVGGNNKIEMTRLKTLFEDLGFQNVSTYINSGNVVFVSTKGRTHICQEIGKAIKKELGANIPILIKTAKEMRKIAQAIPSTWHNDEKHKTDVAYLFPEADTKKILNDLPVNKEYLDIRYVKGALFWNVTRQNYSKSRVNKLISHRVYQLMTMRNVNTARQLGEI